MDQRIIDLHHDYVHHHLDRRLFLERAAKIAGSLSGAAALLPLLDCNFARAQTVAQADPRIVTEDVTFEGVTGEMMAYLARPATAGPHPAIVVVHEAGGLNPHTRDIARRLATEGYVTLAIDFLSPIGGSAQGGERSEPVRMGLGKLEVALGEQLGLWRRRRYLPPLGCGLGFLTCFDPSPVRSGEVALDLRKFQRGGRV